MKIKKSTLLLAASMAVSLAAQASQLAYEGFNYTNANYTALTGLSGGTGGLVGTSYASTPAKLTNGLAYTGFFSSGAAGFLPGGGQTLNGRPWATTNGTNAMPANGTYYYSFLFTPVGNLGKGTFCIFGKPADVQNGFGIRVDDNAGSPQFKSWNPAQSAGANLDFPGGYDKVYFILGKTVINSTGTSTNTIWVYQDPSLVPTSEPTSGGSTCTGGWSGNVDQTRTTLTGRTFSSTTGEKFDEIRIGTAFADVLPPVQLVWKGDGVNNIWDNQVANTDWLLGTTAAYFQTGNYVSFTDSSTNQTVNINGIVQPNIATVNSSSNYVFTGTGKITSTASLVKSGSGTLAINNTNDYNGGTTVSGGILALGTNSAAGSGSITLASGSQRLQVVDGVMVTNSIVLQAGFGTGNGGQGGIQNSSGSGNVTLAGPIAYNGVPTAGGFLSAVAGGTLTVAGPITSAITIPNGVRAGTVILSGGGSYPRFDVADGNLILGAANGVATNAQLVLATANPSTATFDLAGFNQVLAGLGNSANSATVGNSSTTTDSLLTLAGTNNTSYLGSIVDVLGSGTRKVALTVSRGSQTLSGASTYTGDTTINGGLLLVNGSLGSTAVTVSGGGGLGGTGSLAGNLAVNSGGRTFPGGSNTVGTLTISGNYTLANGNTNYFDVGNGAADNINVGGTFSAAATTVIDVNGLGNQVETTYPLISFASGTPVIGNFVLVAHGDFGTLTPSLQVTATTVDLVLQNISAPLVWLGNGATNTWNLSTASTNWLNSNTALLAYFKNADTVTFDDNAVSTSINITATVIPG
ncbi:MAG: autotransporter-associated beta strand repeat-containing protein, partial [Verrucomicrobiota bacterium]